MHNANNLFINYMDKAVHGSPVVQANFLKPAVISLTWGVVLCAPVTLILAPCLMVIGADIVDLFSKIPSILKKQVSPKTT